MRLFPTLASALLLFCGACDAKDTDVDSDTGIGTGDPDSNTEDPGSGTEDPGSDTEDPGSDTEDPGTEGTGGGGTDFPSYASAILHNQSLSSLQGSCSSSAFDRVIPADGENNHWAASRLEPSETPFTVDAISIELFDDPSVFGCRTTARNVMVFKQAGGDPPLRPSGVAGVQNYTITPEDELQRVFMRRELSQSITLNDGDDLWIMVQVESTSNGRTCIRACQDDPQTQNNWFTAGAGHAEPFSWRVLAGFPDITDTNYLIEAYDLP